MSLPLCILQYIPLHPPCWIVRKRRMRTTEKKKRSNFIEFFHIDNLMSGCPSLRRESEQDRSYPNWVWRSFTPDWFLLPSTRSILFFFFLWFKENKRKVLNWIYYLEVKLVLGAVDYQCIEWLIHQLVFRLLCLTKPYSALTENDGPQLLPATAKTDPDREDQESGTEGSGH